MTAHVTIVVAAEKAKLVYDHNEQRELWRKCNAAITDERDEWKRRAEAAELSCTQLRELTRATGADFVAKADGWKRRAEEAEARVATLDARIAEGYLPTIARYMRLNESGPGIAATQPDNSIAHLPEDLLCEDA